MRTGQILIGMHKAKPWSGEALSKHMKEVGHCPMVVMASKGGTHIPAPAIVVGKVDRKVVGEALAFANTQLATVHHALGVVRGA